MRKLASLTLIVSLAAAAVPAVAVEAQRHNRPQTACQDNDRQGGPLVAVGLTADMQLICFKEKRPGNARSIGHISGLMRGDVLVGIDYRVQDKQLYGVSRSGGIYRIDLSGAVATKVGNLTVALEGTSFGVDFNPAADRLRIVSNTGQNLRHNINQGGTTIVDDPLDYPPASPANAVGPTAMGITGSAYTNNDLAPTTATTLFALDTLQDQIALQSPPNDGTLAATGKLGVDSGAETGFDIYTSARGGLQGLASLTTADGKSSLYSVDLLTGKASLRGSFSPQYRVIGLAIPLNQD